ncbi:MAG: hypothetical protein ACFB15_09185 [Cyclobacteriaceae bacterium]
MRICQDSRYWYFKSDFLFVRHYQLNNLIADCSILHGIAVGGARGAIAGITVYTIQQSHNWIRYRQDSARVEQWLKDHIQDEIKHRSTRSIASWDNLTLDRVRYVCSRNPKIYLSTGEQDDL